jgi:signal transduction histidine kinase
MRERTSLLGGTIVVESQLDPGTTFVARMPTLARLELMNPK